MANPARGEKRVDVGGKLYTLRPTFDCLCELEDAAGKPIGEVLAGVAEGRMSGVRAITFALLQDQHSAEIRTLKQASEWIERAGGFDVALGWVTEALALNTEQGEGAEANPPQAQVGTGAPSGGTLVGSA